MTQNATICVGTLGQGIWRSSDGGATWLWVRHGLYLSRACGVGDGQIAATRALSSCNEWTAPST